jgi:hypothetical protein
MSKVICLWASPRNISTAMMYSFAQRKETKVVDEPFYAYYLNNINSNSLHPGKKEILKSQSSNFNEVLKKLNEINIKELLFIKNMTHHLDGQNIGFAKNWCNVILTRSPKKSIASFSKVIKNPTLQDLGYKLQYKLAKDFKKNKIEFYLLQAEDLLINPEKYLMKICDFSKIKFYKEMLTWPKGGIIEDGVWAKYWYKNVHNSTGFKERNSHEETPLPVKYNSLYKEASFYYEALKNI